MRDDRSFILTSFSRCVSSTSSVSVSSHKSDGFSFGHFVRTFPHLKGKITDLLIGDLFKDSLDEVFTQIDAMKAESAGTKSTDN